MKSKNKKPSKRLNESGFTLIELILVITVLGILAISALPTFYDVSSNAKQASRDGVIGAINSGLSLYRSNGLVNNTALTPATLDGGAAGTCTTTNPCFGTVVDNGIADIRWAKLTGNTYSWTQDATITTPPVYSYDSVVGTFVCSANCP